MHILHTEWSNGAGGQERRILSESVGMLKRGHRVTIATGADCWIASEARRLGIPVEVCPMRGKADFRAIRALMRFCRRENVDILHAHSGIDSWVGGIAAKFAGVPAVRTRHLFLPLKYNPINFVHYLFDRFFALGETMRTMLVKECGFPPEKVINIPTGIDFTSFSPRHSKQEIRSTLQINADVFVVLTVAVIRGVKRHDVALRAYKILHTKFPNSLYLIAGEGPMRRDMERLASELGIDDAVRFLGHRTDIADLIRAADVMLLTSRSEAQSQALTQSIGLGLPAVATAVGGVPEVVMHEKTDLLVPPDDPGQTASAILRIAEDPAFARSLGELGKAHALQHYSLEVMLDRSEAVYRQLCANRILPQ
ncbi:MAG: glycosyltransferase family 4 protein [Pseudomonadota bacterium]|nr:glycosyltransferase family 4 protein [Pseudomonadota bacterium]